MALKESVKQRFAMTGSFNDCEAVPTKVFGFLFLPVIVVLFVFLRHNPVKQKL